MNLSPTARQRMRALRKDRKLTLAEVSGAVGIATSSLSAIETGKDDPGLATFIALADFFDVSLDYLEGRAPAPGLGDPRDAPQNEEEVALLHAWRALDGPQQETVGRLMQQLAATGGPASPTQPDNLPHRRTPSRVNEP